MATREQDRLGRPATGWRLRLHRIIWESDTAAGRLFDKVIIAAILISVTVVIVDSAAGWHKQFGTAFIAAEWFFTALFTVEYAARLWSVDRPVRYALSFFGIVDLVAVLPTYLALFFPELHALIDVRVLRLLRVFRIFKLTEYVVVGTLMYVVEGPANGFTDIPTSLYWAITTMTTVGFGDITPKTDFGRFIASAMMLLGWGTLAVPTGIVTAEMTVRRHARPVLVPRSCAECGAEGYGAEANYCQQCGSALPEVPRPTPVPVAPRRARRSTG
jgi:voltage-gated potassium channel